jgi:hypothetical protein
VDACFLGGIDEVPALLDLQLVVHLVPVIGDGVDRCSSGHGFDQRCLIVAISLQTCQTYGKMLSLDIGHLTLTTSAPLL